MCCFLSGVEQAILNYFGLTVLPLVTFGASRGDQEEAGRADGLRPELCGEERLFNTHFVCRCHMSWLFLQPRSAQAVCTAQPSQNLSLQIFPLPSFLPLSPFCCHQAPIPCQYPGATDYNYYFPSGANVQSGIP